jgi:hypothetical protein
VELFEPIRMARGRHIGGWRAGGQFSRAADTGAPERDPGHPEVVVRVKSRISHNKR